MTKGQARILDLLTRQEWVSTSEISNRHVAGNNGTRRLRELRAMGHAIEHRPKADSTDYEYRLKDRANPGALVLF